MATTPDTQPDDEALAAEWAAMAGDEPGAPEGGSEDERLAAEWAAAAGEGVPGGAEPLASPSRELSQNEIDSLLGLSNDARRSDRPGILSLVNSNDITYERLPMLEVVFDRLERMLTTSVRNFTSENVDISLDGISAQRFGDYLNSVPLPAMISVVRAVEWDNYGLVTVDSSLIYSVVDVLLGGRRGMIPMRIEGRPYTTIEMSLVERLIRLVLADLSSAFAPIVPIQFRFERTETNPRFAAIARPGNACIVVKLRVEMEDRGGSLEFLIPYATLEPARDLLLQMFMGEKFGRDSIWESHLAREIWVTDVDIEAVLDEMTVSLDDVLRLQVGSVIRLSARQDDPVTLRCGTIGLMTGRVGQRAGRLAVRIEDRLEQRTGGGDG
jgi:flagellar motor switch protein FliM